MTKKQQYWAIGIAAAVVAAIVIYYIVKKKALPAAAAAASPTLQPANAGGTQLAATDNLGEWVSNSFTGASAGNSSNSTGSGNTTPQTGGVMPHGGTPDYTPVTPNNYALVKQYPLQPLAVKKPTPQQLTSTQTATTFLTRR